MGIKEDEVKFFPQAASKRTNSATTRRLYFFVGCTVGAAVTAFLLGSVFLVMHGRFSFPIDKSTEFSSKPSIKHELVNNTDIDPQCSISNGSDRFDCWPEYRDATEAKCKARGCCWNPSTEQGAPYCYYPLNFDQTYMLMYSTKTSAGVRGHLKRMSKSPYPHDVVELQLEISVESNDRLHIKIYDPNSKRYEVPIQLHKESTFNGISDFDIKLARAPFGIIIRRISTGEILFDTTGVSPLVFADQYIQIGTKLTTPNIYGLGEHRSPLKLDTKWTKIVFWNRDQPPEPNLNLYGSHPFYMNLDKTGNAHGVFLLNSNAMEIDLQSFNGTGALTYRSLGGILDFYVFLGPTPDQVVKQYVSLIGKPFLPPFWSLGFQMCKYGYGSSKELKAVIDRNRAARMPYDVQWNDIDYMNAHLDWTYDTNEYAGLPEIVDDLHSHNQKYVIIVDPGISVTQKPGTYPSYDEGLKMNVFVKTDNGSNLVGKVWPGLTVFPDYFHPNATEWWYNQAKSYHDKIPFDGLWVDMNEPSNFVAGSVSGCTSNSLDNPPFTPPTIDGGSLMTGTVCPSAKHSLSTHYNLHNLYGYSEMKVTQSVLRKLLTKRSFILTRSSYPSAGQYGGSWLGDNLSSWTDLYYSVPGILNYQMFGIPFVGTDICGFREDTNTELCTRWMQLGAFYPFMRNHNCGTKDQDPASFDSATQDIMRSSLELRYHLLPLLYTLLYHSHVDGAAVARPLFFQYPEAVSVDRQFLWGSALLVSPVLDQGATSVSAYIPDDVWYDFYNKSKITTTGKYVTLAAPIDKINLHIRGGSIIPTKPAAVTTNQMRTQKFSLLVALDGVSKASGDLYWDDGDSQDTVENNKYSLVSFKMEGKNLTSTVISSNYKLGDEMKLDNITILGIPYWPSSVTVNGHSSPFLYNDARKFMTVFGLTVDLLKPLTLTWF